MTDSQTSPVTEQAPTPSQEMLQANEENIPEERRNHTALKVILWIVIILVIIVLGLIISAFIAGFSSVFEMIDWIIAEVQRM